MHYYQHHIGDFIRDTANLNDHQLATYLRMLWLYYDTERPLKDDIEYIAFALRSDESTVRLLLKHFFSQTENGWVHARCEREISEYRKKSENARKSANARWTNATAMRTHTDRNANEPFFDANQEPITKKEQKQKLLSPDKSSDPCPHHEIIDLYHRHLPTMAPVKVWTDARRKFLRSRWTEDPARQTLDWWDSFFASIAKSDFLCGRTEKPWTACNLEWIVRPTNFVKILEGQYENKTRNTNPDDHRRQRL